MIGDVNTDTNQSPRTLHQPEEYRGVENPPETQQGDDDPKQDETVPPVEVPGREETPEHIPEKSK